MRTAERLAKDIHDELWVYPSEEIQAFMQRVIDEVTVHAREEYRKQLGELVRAPCADAEAFERVKKVMEGYGPHQVSSVDKLMLGVIAWLEGRVAMLLNEQGHLDAIEAAYARGKADGERGSGGIEPALQHLERLCPDDRVAYLKSLTGEFCRHCGLDTGDGCYCMRDE